LLEARLDRGLTHLAFMVGDLGESVAFYRDYAGMEVVHQREDDGGRVAWISDGTRPFVLVLIESAGAEGEPRKQPRAVSKQMPHFAHLGVACASRQEVDAGCERAEAAGILAMKPRDLGPPVGYFGMISDPDGNHLELSYGQEVGLAVDRGASS
jgi:catechol 2,3-dioxygenase-like lactoylglutathione lyase family enzyme